MTKLKPILSLQPSPEDVSGLIEKLETLKTKVESVQKMPLNFPTSETAEQELLIANQIINTVIGQTHIKNLPQNLPVDVIALIFGKSCIDIRKLNFSVNTLEKMLNVAIPQAEDNMLHGKTPVTYRCLSISAVGGGSQSIENSVEWSKLDSVRYSVEQALKEKVDDAKGKRWQELVFPLIEEIDLELTPYRTYLIQTGYTALGRLDLNQLNIALFANGVKSLTLLNPIIHDLNRLKRTRQKELKAEKQMEVAKPQGRPLKYTNDQLLKMQTAYDDIYREQRTKDSKAAWNKVRKLYGYKSGDAVRIACMKLKKLK